MIGMERGREVVSRRHHKPKIAGSSPAPATTSEDQNPPCQKCGGFIVLDKAYDFESGTVQREWRCVNCGATAPCGNVVAVSQNARLPRQPVAATSPSPPPPPSRKHHPSKEWTPATAPAPRGANVRLRALTPVEQTADAVRTLRSRRGSRMFTTRQTTFLLDARIIDAMSHLSIDTGIPRVILVENALVELLRLYGKLDPRKERRA